MFPGFGLLRQELFRFLSMAEVSAELPSLTGMILLVLHPLIAYLFCSHVGFLPKRKGDSKVCQIFFSIYTVYSMYLSFALEISAVRPWLQCCGK